jgi:inosine-uridine nucleoside N-ribohydrolase
LRQSIEHGATIIGIGPATNLAQLEVHWPGTLARASVVQMGGWIGPPRSDLPGWGPEMDFNLQWDTRAAEIVVAAAGSLTLVPLAVTLQAPLRERDLPGLHATGPLGELLARQSATYGRDQGMAALGRAHPGLPDDLVNFHHDPVAAAVALGWPGVTVTDQQLAPVQDGDLLRFQLDESSRAIRVAGDIDGDTFSAVWLAAVKAAHG